MEDDSLVPEWPVHFFAFVQFSIRSAPGAAAFLQSKHKHRPHPHHHCHWQ